MSPTVPPQLAAAELPSLAGAVSTTRLARERRTAPPKMLRKAALTKTKDHSKKPRCRSDMYWP